MKVALIEYKVRIVPPDRADNTMMDAALALVTGEATKAGHRVAISGKQDIEHELGYYLAIIGLKAQGFTVEVEEITQ